MTMGSRVAKPRTPTGNGVGASATRPDGGLKVRGEFAFSSDLWMDGMLWGATLRSPHAHAAIRDIRTEKALAVTGVFAVLTHEDVPGVNAYGLEHRDQPVLAHDRVRYQGEPVALVAADHPETARRAAALLEVDYDLLPPVTDAHAAVHGATEPLHPGGNVVRHVKIRRGDPVVSVHTAAVEVGQGVVTLQEQIARTELGIERVHVETADTRVGSAGSTSASRQSYVTGGAVQAACRRVAEELVSRASVASGADPETLSLADGHVVDLSGRKVASVVDLLGGEEVVERTVEWRHRPTTTLDPETGQGNAHVQFAFAAHRAVVDVDVELGLVKVVALDCAQDVGRAMNPGAVLGQIHGGSAQGLGLAVMEEIQVVDGLVRNPSFTDYLIPTVLDMPPMNVDVLELADPHAPYGLRGVGEPPTISSTPAVVAAIRDATGLPLTRVPVRPEHITGT